MILLDDMLIPKKTKPTRLLQTDCWSIKPQNKN